MNTPNQPLRYARDHDDGITLTPHRSPEETGDLGTLAACGFTITDPSLTPYRIVPILTRHILEVLAGTRDIHQLVRWLNTPVYRNLLTRATLAARARTAQPLAAPRPTFTITPGRYLTLDRRIEATLIAHHAHRSRAIAMCIEPLHNRWHATALAIL